MIVIYISLALFVDTPRHSIGSRRKPIDRAMSTDLGDAEKKSAATNV